MKEPRTFLRFTTRHNWLVFCSLPKKVATNAGHSSNTDNGCHPRAPALEGLHFHLQEGKSSHIVSPLNSGKGIERCLLIALIP